jgi:hypothetical protein
MAAKAPDNFAQIFPEHPHRRVHILISILAFVLVAGSIVVYQIKMSEKRAENQAPTRDLNEVTSEYLKQAILDMREAASNTPPIPKTELEKAILDMRESASSTEPISQSELEKAIIDMRKSAGEQK